MDLEGIGTHLKRSQLPVAYRAFPADQAPPLPYICYREVKATPFAADGQVYYSPRRIVIELYTAQRDSRVESTVEQVLNDFGVWSREEIYLETEKSYEIYYEVEV